MTALEDLDRSLGMPLTSALEKAARAYAAAEGYPDDFNDDADGEYRTWCFEVARAVLMAVREPIPDHVSGRGAEALDVRPSEAKSVFTAMIDAILNEEPK